MSDIGIVWDQFYATGDWARPDQTPTGAEDGTGGDLTAAVLVSLFTDRRAPDDFTPRDGTQDRRGWWADAYEDEPIGSLLWTLQPSKKTRAVLLAVRDYCNQALAWLVRDGHAASVVVDTFWAGQVSLGIVITVIQTKGPGAVIRTSLPISGGVPIRVLNASSPSSSGGDDVGFFTGFMGRDEPTVSGGPAALGSFILGTNTLS